MIKSGDYVIRTHTPEGDEVAIKTIPPNEGVYCIKARTSDNETVAVGLLSIKHSDQVGIRAVTSEGSIVGLGMGGEQPNIWKYNRSGVLVWSGKIGDVLNDIACNGTSVVVGGIRFNSESLWKLNSSGAVAWSVDTGGNVNTLRARSNIVTCGGSTLRKYNMAGALQWSVFSSASGVDEGASGKIFTCFGTFTKVYSSAGAVLKTKNFVTGAGFDNICAFSDDSFIVDRGSGDLFGYICEYDSPFYPLSRHADKMKRCLSDSDDKLCYFAGAVSFKTIQGTSPIECKAYTAWDCGFYGDHPPWEGSAGTCLDFRGNTWWVGTSSGYKKHVGNAWPGVTTTSYASGQSCKRIAVDSSENVWII